MGADAAVTRKRKAEGLVLEELPQGKFQVALTSGQRVLAHPASGTVRNFVRLLPGDRVEVELAPHDWTRGRIIRKLTEPRP